MDEFDDYTALCARERLDAQLKAIRSCAADAAALTAGSEPWFCEKASELIGLANEAIRTYAVKPASLRGVLLSEMLAITMHLYKLGSTPAANPDDAMVYYVDIMPAIRGCIKFLSDEIAALARDFVQTDDGVRNVVLEEFAALDHINADRKVARALHERDAAYAAAHPPVESIAELMRRVDLEDGLEDGPVAGHEDGELFDPEDDCEVHGCDGDCDEDCPCPCHAEPEDEEEPEPEDEDKEPDDEEPDDEEPDDEDKEPDEEPDDTGAAL